MWLMAACRVAAAARASVAQFGRAASRRRNLMLFFGGVTRVLMHDDGLLALVAGRRAPGSRRAIPWRILAMLLSVHAIVAAKGGRSSANATEALLLLPKRSAADPTSLDRLDELKLRLTRVLGEALEPTSRRKYKIRVVESEG